MQIWSEVRALLLAWTIIAVMGGIVALLVRRVAGDTGPILPPQRRRAIPWTGPLVAIAFLTFYFVPPIILHYIDPGARIAPDSGADAPAKPVLTSAASAADLIALPLQIALWYLLGRLPGGSRRVFGVVPRRIASDYASGYRTWLLLTPIVYLVSFAAIFGYALWVGKPPAEHPIVEKIQEKPGFGFITLLFVQAVIAAPLREELFFRGILQSFFAERSWGGDFALWLAVVIGVMAHPVGSFVWSDLRAVASAFAPVLLVLAVLPFYLRMDSWNLSRWLPIHDPPARRRAARAIVGTALLFANFHATVWPTPIPLFFLALGLGWLAYRTQGVVAPIAMHMLFNAIVLVALPFGPHATVPVAPEKDQGAIGKPVTVAVFPESADSTDKTVSGCSFPRRT